MSIHHDCTLTDQILKKAKGFDSGCRDIGQGLSVEGIAEKDLSPCQIWARDRSFRYVPLPQRWLQRIQPSALHRCALIEHPGLSQVSYFPPLSRGEKIPIAR